MTPANSLLNPWSNDMYAPSWAAVTPQLPGFCDVDFDYGMGVNGIPMAVQVLAGQTLIGRGNANLQIQIDSDADYLAREIFVAPIGGSSGNANPQDLKIRLTDAGGHAVTSDWVTANDLCGPVGPIPLPFAKGGIIFIDLWNQGTATLLVQVGLKGFKRLPCTETQPTLPPFISVRQRYCKPWKGVRFEEYEYAFQFSNGGSLFLPPWTTNLQPYAPNQTFTQFPLPTDNDAAFLWRGITGMIMRTGGPVAQIPQEAFLGFYDSAIIPLFKNVPRLGVVPNTAPPGAELVISDGGGRMVPMFPEILVPAGAVIPVDVLLQIPGDVNAVQFSLRGFKVYNEADCAI